MNKISRLKLIRHAVAALFCISWSIEGLAFDKEAYCRMSMEENKKRAEWGAQLRIEMLSKCTTKNLQQCGQKYVKLIDQQYEKDVAAFIDMFNKQSVSQVDRIYLQGVSVNMKSAALEALKFDKNPNSIVIDMYSDCLRGR